MDDHVINEILERLDKIEYRLSKLERYYEKNHEPYSTCSQKKLTPALVRVLAVIKENRGIGDPKTVADKLDIPRNIASVYLNRLASMGFLYKKTNADPRIKARYVYEMRRESIDEKLRELMEAVKNERWRLR